MFLNTLSEHYFNQILNISFKGNFKHILKIPKIKKIILNFGFKNISENKNQLILGLMAIELISGQKAKPSKSKKSVLELKIRKNMITGCKVTLRKEKMFNFLIYLVTIILSKIKQFTGLKNKKLSNIGNFSFIIKDLFVFYEIEKEYEAFLLLKDLNITFVTTANNSYDLKLLLSSLQIPYRN